MLSHSIPLTPIYLFIKKEIQHTIFEIRNFNKHSENVFQTLFSNQTNKTL